MEISLNILTITIRDNNSEGQALCINQTDLNILSLYGIYNKTTWHPAMP